jgi:hypothetical protein
MLISMNYIEDLSVNAGKSVECPMKVSHYCHIGSSLNNMGTWGYGNCEMRCFIGIRSVVYHQADGK